MPLFALVAIGSTEFMRPPSTGDKLDWHQSVPAKWNFSDRLWLGHYFRGKNSGHIARHAAASGRKSSGPTSWHSASAAGNTQGCALFMNICAAGTSHDVASTGPARP